MIQKRLLTGLWCFLICSVTSYAGADETDVSALRRRQFVNEDVFLSITNGSSLLAVMTTLGPAVRHEFAAAENGHTWTLIKCFLHTGEAESYTFYQLLFRDGTLVKTIGWIQMEMEEYPYRGTTASRFKPWGIEDRKYVRKAIEAPAVTPDQIRAKLKGAQETMDKHKGQGNIPSVVGYLFSLPFQELAEKGYPLNEQLRQHFDGCKVSVGMTTNEVQALYGIPLHAFATGKGDTAQICGDDRHFGNSVDSFLVFSCVAVLFDSNGRVVAVYSDAFLCKDWYSVPNVALVPQ